MIAGKRAADSCEWLALAPIDRSAEQTNSLQAAAGNAIRNTAVGICTKDFDRASIEKTRGGSYVRHRPLSTRCCCASPASATVVQPSILGSGSAHEVHSSDSVTDVLCRSSGTQQHVLAFARCCRPIFNSGSWGRMRSRPATCVEQSPIMVLIDMSRVTSPNSGFRLKAFGQRRRCIVVKELTDSRSLLQGRPSESASSGIDHYLTRQGSDLAKVRNRHLRRSVSAVSPTARSAE